MSQVLLNIINDLNVSNTKTGTLLVNYGGTGVKSLSSNQILVGNSTGAVIQSSNLLWDNSNNILNATNFVGSGSGLTELNSSKITLGTLNVAQGGTGTTNLNNNQLLVGNGVGTVIQSDNLSWDNTNNILNATNFVGSGSGLTELNSSKITLGTLNVAQGGTGTTNLNSNQLLVGNGTGTVIQSGNLSWDNSNNILNATNFVGSGSGLTELNASKITLGTLNVAQGGTGTTNLTSGKILVGNGTNAVIQNNNFTWDNTNSRVGIGKTNPSTTLDVSGNILTNSQFLGTGTNISYSWENDTTTGIGKPATSTIGFYTNNNERFRIQSNGDVNFDNNTLYVDSINNRIGIGTNMPSTSLHINGNAKVDGSLTVQSLTVNGTTTIIDTNTQTTEQLIITNDGTGPAVIINQLGNQPILQLQGTNTTVLQVLNDGLISVGVTNPTAKMDISVNNNIGLKINQYNDNYNIIDLQSSNTSILTLNKNNMVVNNKFTLDTSGNLIIKGNIYGKNTISKVGFRFTVKSVIDPITSTNVYYYNVNLSKYYTTNQTISSNNIQVFRLTTFDISGNEIETDFVYISSFNGGIKKIIKNRIAVGDSQIYGWSSNESNNTYLTYYSNSIKTLYCILEPIL
jgi:molybdate-binding protein